ncbi:MAG: HPF/RaiA family ribosome-associated protein [bacterium]|jgi:ribosomal subunit interface protein
MKIIFYSKGINLDDNIRKTISQKFERLDRYFSKIEKFANNEDSVYLDLYIDYQKGFYNVKAILNLDGEEIVIKDNTNELIDVINSIVDSLEVKLSKYKDKVIVGSRHKMKLSHLESRENIENFENIGTNLKTKEIDVIRKRLSVPVISENKAINSILSDDELKYMVFYNRDTDKLSLIEKIDSNTISISEIVI